ncbi:hypothetical protein G195_011148 [Phytophthora kernoviae 00238/432]|uniref:RxLR effector protein n=1 Tax=Phytophthora kernoviae 00238/432 TaxID=1284355 RepID=A0A8J4RQI4_9STRA|nr:hypothetical protein G195_011148 [Phytophthora kernoviae 00238/432]
MVTLLADSETFATVTESDHSKVLTLASHDIPFSGQSLVADSNDSNEKRYLRTTKLTDNDDKERAGGLSNFFNKLGKRVQRRFWLETKKSDDFILKKFGLTGLTGKELTGHKNYKAYMKLSYKAEGYKLNGWLREDLPTFGAWNILRLEDKVTLGVSLETIMKTKEYGTYKRYVGEFDDNVLSTLKAGYTPNNQIPRLASKTEMTAKAQIWAENGMKDDYVLYALGLSKLKGDALKKADDYKYDFSDDYVKKVLELQGLTGNALMNHKKYKYFQKFAQLKLTKEFKIYERYIKEFEDFIISKPNAGFKPKYNQISKDVSAAEMTAKEELWAST